MLATFPFSVIRISSFLALLMLGLCFTVLTTGSDAPRWASFSRWTSSLVRHRFRADS